LIWFFERPNRLVAERRAVTALASSVDWLDDFGFGIGDGARLVLHFTVAVGDAKVDLELRYPRLYPDTCPDVVPRDPNLRLSDHQWSGGSLCLEYRTDNWRPEFTAADMIRSAQALLSAEATTEGGAARLPSAHELTQGQRLRAADYRHVYSDALVDLLRQAAPGTRMAATMRFQFQGSAVVARIDAVDTPDGRWLQPGFPQDGHQATGVVMLQPEPVTADTELDLTNAELPREWARLCANTDANPEAAEFALVLGGSGLRMAWRWLQTHAHLIPVVPVHAGSGGSERIGSIQPEMAAKAVAVVGCGSAGSKVAASLARSGIGRFVLVDDDVLLRDNLVRNDLDWRAVGAHKVHAVAARLRLINPEVTVSARALRLGGQEASGSVDTALEALSQCDLIVDATADANAFNIVSAVARRAGRPMVWLEVFEGGIGGMVARYRPGLDAPPQDMRSAYLDWCGSLNAPWLGTEAGDYATEADGGKVLVADDAEVGIIANHAARFAIDALTGGNAFPHPIYTVALRAGWIFTAPFEAHPLDVTVPETVGPEVQSDEDRAEAVEIFTGLFTKDTHEDPAA
jgi:sulfur-carrier protein adenylyltransferase/sulfurtransferase